MRPRDIIARAWAITNSQPQLRKWGFAHAALSTLLNAKLFLYQAWLAYSVFWLKEPIGFFKFEELLFGIFPTWIAVTIVGFFVIALIVEWLFPHLAKGAIIGLAAKAYRKEEVKGGLVLGVYNFFPLFAIHEMLVLSGMTTVITLCSLSLRYGADAGPIACILLILTWIASLILEFFWIFAEEAVVVSKLGIRKAIKRSFKLVISHLSHVVFLLLLMLIIILRIVGNLLMVILLPGIIMGLGFLLSSLMPPLLSYSLSGILGLVIIGFASYFFAYLEVFRQTVWTITYIELNQLKDLDVIEESGESPSVTNEPQPA